MPRDGEMKPDNGNLGSIKDSERYDFRFRWLASYPKSGNTWVRMFVHAYRAGTLDINGMGNQSDTSRVAYQGATCQPLDKLSDNQSVMVRPAAMLNLQLMFASYDNERPIVKTHCANVSSLGITMIPPAVTHSAVHIVRDPRDVICSWADHFGQTYDEAIAQTADPGCALNRSGVLQLMTDWSSHTHSWRQHGNVLTVRYEDLLDAPYVTFAKIVRHIGDEWDQERFETALSLTAFDNLQAEEQSKGFVEAQGERFFRKGRRGQWKDVLTSKQVGVIEDAHGEQMREMGYL
jgi:hypothetical protein